MRSNLNTSKRQLLPVFLLTLCQLFSAGQCFAQQSIANVADADASDLKAFRFLFRRAAMYRDIQDRAAAAHQDKSYLKRTLAERLKLNTRDDESLQRVTTEYQREIAPVEAQVQLILKRFRERFSKGAIRDSLGTSPPLELAQLQLQEDAIVLSSRDQLRNSMSNETYAGLRNSLLSLLGNGAVPADQTPQAVEPNR